MSTIEELEVATVFKVARHPGLMIIWEIGSAELQLVRIGGPKGSYKMQTKKHASYKNSRGAFNAAVKWFTLLDKVYEPTPVTKSDNTAVVTV